MNTIQEALHELQVSNLKNSHRNLHERYVLREAKEPVITDLWDQVYCSLTDGGVNAVYKALGKLNGKNKYGVEEVNVDPIDDKSGYTGIQVVNKDHAWAKSVANAYRMPFKEREDGSCVIYVPHHMPVDFSLIVPEMRKSILKDLKIQSPSLYKDMEVK